MTSRPEQKPAWRSVPARVRSAVAEALGSPVLRAQRAWGGYSATPTFRLRLADGRRAFFKSAGPASTAFARVAHEREERVYRELGDVISGWSPRFLSGFAVNDWRVMLLEDVGPKTAPPWSRALARHVARGLAAFHGAVRGREIPLWVPRPDRHPALGIRPPAWKLEVRDLDLLAGLARDRSREARAWLRSEAPVLAKVAAQLADPGFSHTLLHVDVRSDNLRWVGGRLVLFDWPHVAVGPPEFDAAAFAQTVTVEGGPDPERLMAWYGEEWPVESRALDASVAAIAGYFARNAWVPELPELPRVRAFQRAQLAVTLRWAARRLDLPKPAWTDAIDGDQAR